MTNPALTLATLALIALTAAPVAAFELPNLWFPAAATTTLSTQSGPAIPAAPTVVSK